MTLAENLKRLRGKESQKSLAKRAGVSQQLIDRLERGVDLSTKKLPQLAAALGVALSELDPTFSEAVLQGPRAELAAIYERLPAAWRTYLLDQAKQLESRVLGGEAPQSPSPATPPKSRQKPHAS